ncbi:Exocyst complex component 2 [Monoraphidium neglectum]|uniref:Exocyst complex component SEC5 n=1 Tax=Monoraphidium neglectum TaxID=145388 RepID=A0A0D2MRV1_9CHLO|nr:Exocyst complex component 2 [Monoraphidium neglectum]KIZ03142.1 Exocyst complex component 2 [Monoraphidium neglectum]|eukprot:XP_013902161.1 Exocyst complex component 2 [Monoraphidium neglectum]
MSRSQLRERDHPRGGGRGVEDDDEEYLTDDEEDEGDADDDGQEGRRALACSTAAGPATWQEVDRGELSASALALISSIAQTAPTDDRSRDAVWHPTTTVTVTQELVDPLGLGRIDPAAMRLERRSTRDAAPQARSNATGVNVDAGPGQAKGAVGRFFSELTARGGGSGGGKDGGRSHARGSAGGPSGSGRPVDSSPSTRRRTSVASRASNLPTNMLLPTMEGFDPEAYLAVFHEATSPADLAAGLTTLERELGERQGQLKTLVKQNFDRFISCKTTIDDIYVKLQRIESAGTGISTQVLCSAVEEVQASARVAFGPLLERHSKAERIKSVQALLRRFQPLFSMPSRIRSLASAHDYEQVCAEYKKANALIRPGSNNTAKVWARLHTEIERRVGEVWLQLEAEVAHPELPAASAPELLLHMLALQAEGLPLAQGKDPVGLLLEARERRARSEMASAQDHQARAMARLRERYCAVVGAESAKPQPLQSRLVQNTSETPGEQLMLNHVAELSSVLLSCLPGFWATASSGRLADVPDLPPAVRARLRQSLKTVAATAQKLVESYCRDVQKVAGALAAVGPLRSATAALVQRLARVVESLRELRAPPSAVASVLGVLRYGLEAAVRQLASHLEQLPATLASPLDGELPADITTRPLHVAFFACLGQCTACLAALAERYNPHAGDMPSSARGGDDESGGSSTGGPDPGGGGGSPREYWRRGPQAQARGVLLYDSDDDAGEGGGAGGSGSGGPAVRGGLQGGRGGVGVGGVAGVSDDVRLLLTASNLSYIRTKLMGSLTQRFLLVLTGEVASEVERVSRTIKGLAKRMDAALQAMFDLYRDRKRRQLERLMSAYVRADGGPVGTPPELRDITPGVAGLLQALAQVQAEAYTYARLHMSYLLPPLLEAVASGLSARYAALAPEGLAPEALAQYFLDLSWLDGTLSAAGPPSVRVDIDAGYMLLAQRIAGFSAGAAVTPLGRSLAAVRDPAELSKRLQVTCRKLLPDILGRSTFTTSSFLPVQ